MKRRFYKYSFHSPKHSFQFFSAFSFSPLKTTLEYLNGVLYKRCIFGVMLASRLRTLDMALDGFMGMEAGIGSEVAVEWQTPKTRNWEAIANRNDIEILTRWDTEMRSYAGKKSKHVSFDDINNLSLLDVNRPEIYDPLCLKNKECIEAWASRSGGRRLIDHSEQIFYPCICCKENGRGVGFDFLNYQKMYDEDQYPGLYDGYGTYDVVFGQTDPALMLNHILKKWKSKHIDFTLICKGFEEFNEDKKHPIIPATVPDEEAELNVPIFTPTPVTPILGNVLRDMEPCEVPIFNGDGSSESQVWYITERNVDAYFSAMMDSEVFLNAVGKMMDPEIHVRRICMWVYVKAHAAVLVWDTLYDKGTVIQHRIYESTSVPQEVYPYKDDFREGRMKDSILRAFSEALTAKGYLDTLQPNVLFFNDTKYRATFRANFFPDVDPMVDDLACVAFQMLVSIYFCMVENTVDHDDTRAVVFSSPETRRYFRFVTKAFQTDLVDFLRQQIVDENKAVLLPASMAAPTINADKVQLVSIDPTNHNSAVVFFYGGYDRGFVQVPQVARRMRGRALR